MFKKLWFFCLINCALGLDAYVLSGLLPSIAYSLQSKPEQIGIGIAIFTLAYGLSTPILGNFIRSIHTFHILQASIGLFIVGNIFTIYATSLDSFVFGRLIAGIGAGLFSPLAFATAIKLSDQSKKGQAISIVLAGLSVGTAFGVPFGLWLSQQYTWKVTIFCIISLSIIGLVALIFNHKKIPLICNTTSIFNKNMMNKNTISILGVTFFTGFASLGLYSYLGQLLLSQNLIKINIYAMWLWGLGGCVGAFSVGKLLDRYISNRSMTTCILLLLIISFLFLFLGKWQFTLIACLVWGYAGWSSIVPQQHKLTSIPNVSHQSILALNASLNYLGGAIGTLFASYVAYMHYLNDLPIILILFLLLSILLHILNKKYEIRH